MNFTPEMLAKVLDGSKTQTRRRADNHEIVNRLVTANGTKRVETRRFIGLKVAIVGGYNDVGYGDVHEDYSEWRAKWQTGRIYAVAPGRGKKSVAKIRLLDIRMERACDISDADARAEGFSDPSGFFAKWRSLYGDDVPLDDCVYALTFELVK